jgi:hypothetical protein
MIAYLHMSKAVKVSIAVGNMLLGAFIIFNAFTFCAGQCRQHVYYNSMRPDYGTNAVVNIPPQPLIPSNVALAVVASLLGLVTIVAAIAFLKSKKWAAIFVTVMGLLSSLGAIYWGCWESAYLLAAPSNLGKVGFILALAALPLILFVFESFFIRRYWQSLL